MTLSKKDQESLDKLRKIADKMDAKFKSGVKGKPGGATIMDKMDFPLGFVEQEDGSSVELSGDAQ